MGKRKREQNGGVGGDHCPATVFVTNLPYSFQSSQLEDAFSEVGPVRRCFVVTKKGSDANRGFGFVQFAAAEDARRAIQMKSGLALNGRKIKAELAIRRLSRDLRLKKANNGKSTDGNEDFDGSDSSSVAEIDANVIEETEHHNDNGGADEGASASEGNEPLPMEVDYGMEAEIARKILENLIKSSLSASHSKATDTVEKEKTANSTSREPPVPGMTLLTAEKGEMKRLEHTSEDINKKDGDLDRTVFISNIPFEIGSEEVIQRFSLFGEVQSFVPVLHHLTKRPRGTAFLKFRTETAADAAISSANDANGLGIILKGRPLKVLKALDKESAQKRVLEKIKNEVQDRRNLYLAKEGEIPADSSAAEGVSKADMEKREMLAKKKIEMLRSPKFHVSRTRLIIYNVPKTMTEEEVKKMCIDAILSRASKQNPEIQKVKLLKDDKKGKASAKKHSRGVAFVNFMEHEHALVALRVLNNNPGTFGSERRPIVEFALEDLNKLRLQKVKLDSLKRKNVDSDGRRSSTHVDIEKRNLNKTKHQRSKNEASQLRADTDLTKEETELVEKGNNKETSKKELVGRRKNRVSAIRKISKSTKPNQMKSVVKPNSEASSSTKQTQLKEEKKAQSVALRETYERRPNKESMVKSRKRKLRVVNGSKQKRKKSSKPEEVDKLDRLIEQYRSKFAGIKSSKPKDDAQTGGHKEVRRWFELA